MASYPDSLDITQAKSWEDIALASGAVPPRVPHSEMSDAERMDALIKFYRRELNIPEGKFLRAEGPIEQGVMGYTIPASEQIFISPRGFEETLSTHIHELLHGKDLVQKKNKNYPREHFSFAEPVEGNKAPEQINRESALLGEIALLELIDKMRAEAIEKEEPLRERMTGNAVNRKEFYEMMYPKPEKDSARKK